MNKRNFIKNSTLLGLAGISNLGAIAQSFANVKFHSDEDLASDDNFWQNIHNSYLLKTDYINLENGYYCIMPNATLEKYIEHIRKINMQGAYYMRTVQFENKKMIAGKLAQLAGCNSDELIITRNTTESLNMIISGWNWQQGDEAVMAEQDYGAMLDMFKQESRRHGIVNKIVSIPIDPTSDDEIVEIYANAISSKTKLLMVSHIINITGQILPIKKICDMARSKNVKVMVDGAHAFAHINFKISDLGCHFYGCSLHKWLSSPLGAGMLYVNKNSIADVWPLFAESDRPDTDISRLNHTGTIPVHTDLAIMDAIDFYNSIGAQRKEARLRFLQNYWIDKIQNVPNIILNTPSQKSRSCAIANVGIKGMKPKEQAEILLNKYKVYTVAIDNAGVAGCRITPNVFTQTSQLDVFVNALLEMAK